MMRTDPRSIGLACALMFLSGCSQTPQQVPVTLPDHVIELTSGWQIASSEDVAATGGEVSSAGFETSSWIPASVPTTVMAALVSAGEISDPYYDQTLESISTEQFEVPWWYRTEFRLDQLPPAGARLTLDGLNYRADVWLNGEQVANSDSIAGAFRVFELEVGKYLKVGTNSLAISVSPPRAGEPTIGFVDWNPTSPDRNMGLWRGVSLELLSGVSIENVVVRSELDPAALEVATLEIEMSLTNHTEQAIEARLDASVTPDRGQQSELTVAFGSTLQLAPGESRRVSWTEEEHPELRLDNPKLWWPHDLGDPHLYQLEVIARSGSAVQDHQKVDFGIRQIADYMTEEGHRGYEVNGKKLLIRGGGWVDDMMLADSDQKVEDQVRYARHLGLNTIRLEGFWGSSHHLYDLADRYGMLIMVGWSCQWEWEEYLGSPVDEFGGIKTPEDQELVAISLRDQVMYLRNHPSIFVWVLASDMLPRAELEQRYLDQLALVDSTRPVLAACSIRNSEVSGATGVKMNGPYEYVPPSYWYLDRERGGAFGFNTETGPGAQPPPLESIQRMLPEDHWWPIDEMWAYHCGRNEFNTLERFRTALDGRYGASASLEEFAGKSQISAYEAMRAMFEAFSVRRPETTGIIQWMLNSAWPEMFWQLYDYYLVPNGAYFGARKANQPVHLIYDYGHRSIVAINDSGSTLTGTTAHLRVFDSQSKLIHEARHDLEAVTTGDRLEVDRLPQFSTPSGVSFVDLELTDSDGRVLGSNFYWLPNEEDELDWDESTWFMTPVSEFADLSAVTSLESAAIEVEHQFSSGAEETNLTVTLSNPTEQLAFFVELRVIGEESGELIAPILWEDNYVSLIPGEQVTISATIPKHALDGQTPVFRYRGFNVEQD